MRADLGDYPYRRTMTRTTILLVLSWFAVGVMFIVGAVTPYGVVANIVPEGFMELILGIQLVIGSFATLASRRPWPKESTVWSLELIGWPLLTSAWGLFSFFAIFIGPGMFGEVLAVAATIACGDNFMQTLRTARRTRHNVAELAKRNEVEQ